MAQDPPMAAGSSEVMASIDAADVEPRLVIADISADGAWLSMPAAGSASLYDCR